MPKLFDMHSIRCPNCGHTHTDPEVQAQARIVYTSTKKLIITIEYECASHYWEDTDCHCSFDVQFKFDVASKIAPRIIKAWTYDDEANVMPLKLPKRKSANKTSKRKTKRSKK